MSSAPWHSQISRNRSSVQVDQHLSWSSKSDDLKSESYLDLRFHRGTARLQQPASGKVWLTHHIARNFTQRLPDLHRCWSESESRIKLDNLGSVVPRLKLCLHIHGTSLEGANKREIYGVQTIKTQLWAVNRVDWLWYRLLGKVHHTTRCCAGAWLQQSLQQLPDQNYKLLWPQERVLWRSHHLQ